MGTFRVAGASEYLAITGWGIDDVKLAKKAWVWLGQRCTTLDAAPASYELEAHGITADKFPVVLRAVYTTVGLNTKIDKGNEDLPFLLLHGATDKLAARTKKLVNGVFEGRVRALAATMTTVQICVKGSTSFAKEVLEGARLDLSKYGLRVHSAADERLAVNMQANKLSLAVVDEEIRAAPTTVMMAAATKKKAGCDNKQSTTTVVGAGVHVQMDVEGKNDVLMRLTNKFKQPEQLIGKAAAASAAVASDGAKVEESKHERQKAAAEYVATRMMEMGGDLYAIKADVTMDRVTRKKAIEEHLQAASDFLEQNLLRLRPTEARKADQGLLDELLAKAEHAATDLQTLAGKIRAFKVQMKVESTNMQRLEDKMRAAAADDDDTQDSNAAALYSRTKVDMEAAMATTEHVVTRTKELAGDIRALMDSVAMDIKDAAEVAKSVTGSLEADAEATKVFMEVMSGYLN